MPARIHDVARPVPSSPAAAAKPSFNETTLGKQYHSPSLNYTVKAGDTLSSIGRKFGTDAESLYLTNRDKIADKNQIKVGQSIALPTSYYVVKPGDTYSKIGREMGIDAQKLMGLNGARSDALRPGQTVQVPSVTSPELATTRSDLKALVDDMAKAESSLYFGPGSFTSDAIGHSFHTSGPAESGKSYEFSHDLKHLQIWDASDEESGLIPIQNKDAFRQLLVSDVMAGVLHSRAHKHDEKFPDMAGQFKVLEGPTVKDGKVSFTIDEPMCHDAKITWDSKTGKLTYDHSASGTKTIDAGKNPSEVANSLAKLLNLKLPMYEF